MKKIFHLCFFLMLFSFGTHAQDSDTPEIWYVWIDTEVDQDGQKFRLVSETPFKISCCVKSPKYRKLSKKAQKWVIKNYDPSFDNLTVFNKVQDEDLAKSMISKAQENNGDPKNVLLVSYQQECK